MDNGTINGMLQDMSALIAEWHWGNEKLLSGTFSCRLLASAHPGVRCDYVNKATSENLSFYVEGVTHSFDYPGASSTTLAVTRGTETADANGPFPHLLSLDELRNIATVPQIPPAENLRIGSTTLKDVELAQTLLGKAVFSGVPVNGVFDADMAKIVKTFQESYGLPPTGMIDQDTWQRLFDVTGSHSVKTQPTGKPIILSIVDFRKDTLDSTISHSEFDGDLRDNTTGGSL